jgi:hypothetical protein
VSYATAADVAAFTNSEGSDLMRQLYVEVREGSYTVLTLYIHRLHCTYTVYTVLIGSDLMRQLYVEVRDTRRIIWVKAHSLYQRIKWEGAFAAPVYEM